MSGRASNSPPPPHRNAAPIICTQFPKWNGMSNRNTPKLKLDASDTKQSFGLFLIDTFRALPAIPGGHRPAPRGFAEARKLENRLTRFHSATSKFLIDNFQRLVSSRSFRHPKILIGRNSNRHTYEKLEVPLNIAESATSIFLIDTKQHFIQGGPTEDSKV